MRTYESLTVAERNSVGERLARALYEKSVELGVETRLVLLMIAPDSVTTLKNVSDAVFSESIQTVHDSIRRGASTDAAHFDARDVPDGR